VPSNERLRPNDLKNRKDGWKPAIELDKEYPIAAGQPNPAPALTPQHDQLLPEDRILSLKPRARSERRRQDGKKEPEEPDHPTSLRDSLSSSME
jgi:hypothetical protein